MIVTGGLSVAAVVVLALVVMFWDWLSDGESGSTTVRNVALVLAGVVALPLAIWRSMVADRQAKTAQQGLLNERYQKGAEMLGSDVLSVRLAGIYALRTVKKADWRGSRLKQREVRNAIKAELGDNETIVDMIFEIVKAQSDY